VDDHVAGDYTVAVTFGGVTVSKTFENVFVIRNANNLRPKLTSPREVPQWYDGVNQTEYEAAMLAFNNAGGTSVFAPNTDTDGVDGNDTLVGAIFKWKAPDINRTMLGIPDNVRVAYQISISRFEAADQAAAQHCWEGHHEECNTEIYNSWWEDRAIMGTSFTLPIPLEENTVNETAIDEYNVGVNLVFIDKATGREVAQGGYTNASFKVGQPPYPLNGSEDINMSGTVSGTLPTWLTDDTNVDQNLTVAMIAEKCVEGDNYNWTCTSTVIASAPVNAASLAAGYAYELNTTVGTIKANLADGKNINLIVFNDGDSDGQWDQWNEGSDYGEPSWWLMDKGFWFETWGDFRINVQNGEFVSIPVNSAAGATVTGMNITVE